MATHTTDRRDVEALLGELVPGEATDRPGPNGREGLVVGTDRPNPSGLGEIEFGESIVKENLDEILLLLIALRGSAHGKALMSDLDRAFDARLSPGTVYPRLHRLEEEGVLAMHKCVRTKEYSIDDVDAARERVSDRMRQQLLLGTYFYACTAGELLERAGDAEVARF